MGFRGSDSSANLRPRWSFGPLPVAYLPRAAGLFRFLPVRPAVVGVGFSPRSVILCWHDPGYQVRSYYAPVGLVHGRSRLEELRRPPALASPCFPERGHDSGHGYDTAGGVGGGLSTGREGGAGPIGGPPDCRAWRMIAGPWQWQRLCDPRVVCWLVSHVTGSWDSWPSVGRIAPASPHKRGPPSA